MYSSALWDGPEDTLARASQRKREFVAARNRTERVLVEIWCKVLDQDPRR